MPLQKLPVIDLDNINHRRRARETINQVLDHSFDDSRRQTSAEKLAGVTPVNYAWPPYWVPRYGENVSPGVTDMTAAIQAAIDAGAEAGQPGYLPGFVGNCLVIGTLAITKSSSGLIGDGSGSSRMVFIDDGITVADGLQFVHIHGLSIAAAVRWTDTPHGFVGITINGTSLSQNFFCRFDDLFIDGFEANFIANGVSQCFFTRIDSENCNRGFVSEAKSFNCFIDNSAFVGAIGSSATGIAIGDGFSAAEGWVISDSLIFGFLNGVVGFGSNNSQVTNCIIDYFSTNGVLLLSDSNAATNWGIESNYMAGTGTASYGIRCSSGTISSDPRGNRIKGNDILVYPGSTLTTGIFIDGSFEVDNLLEGNHVRGTTLDCSIVSGSGHRVIGNRWQANGFYTEVMTTYEGNEGTNTTPLITRQTNGSKFIYHVTGGAPAVAGVSYNQGDLAWELNLTAAATPGYGCITAGVAGASAWKAMANLAA